MGTTDWIRMRVDLYRDPKVCIMADCLMDPDGDLAKSVERQTVETSTFAGGMASAVREHRFNVTRNVTRNAVCGALVTVWGVCRHRGKRRNDDLLLSGAGTYTIDDIADLPGFGEAMVAVGWLVEMEDGIVFPRYFAEFNDELPGRKRPMTGAERTAKWRKKNNDVTPVTECDACDASETETETETRQTTSVLSDLMSDADLLYSDFCEEKKLNVGRMAEIAHKKLRLTFDPKQTGIFGRASVLVVAGRIPEAWYWDAVEAAKQPRVKNRPGYFRRVLGERIEKHAAGEKPATPGETRSRLDAPSPTTQKVTDGQPAASIHPAGFEPATFGSVDRCSIQLS